MKSFWFMVLCLLRFGSATVYFVDGVNGPNTGADGISQSSAFRTIGACVTKLENPGDECKVAKGRYHEVIDINGLKATAAAPFKISGLGDDRPIWDGTVPITRSKWNFDKTTGICSGYISQDITALFYNEDLLTAARWPNALWSDRSCFNNSFWGKSSTSSNRGKMVDNGDLDLEGSGINATDAMAILNIGSFNTFCAKVKKHEPGKKFFMYKDTFGKIHFKTKNNQYYLEASLELLDAPEEWFYDKDTKILSLIPPVGHGCPDPTTSTLRGRTIDYALTIRNTTGLSLANMTFFASNIDATTVAGSTYIDEISLENIDMKFGASSHRMLKIAEKPKWTRLVAYAGWGAGMLGAAKPGPVYGKVSVVNCSFVGSEGAALEYGGDGAYIHNNLFAWNDWTGHLMDVPTGGLGAVTGVGRAVNEEFSQNTVFFNGASVGVRPGTHGNISYNHVAGQCAGLIQNDGAGVQFQGASQNEADVHHNWVRDSPKYGLRFDSSPNNFGANGNMSFNVAFNTNGMMAKGDHHTLLNNLAFGKYDDPNGDNQGSGCTLCVIYKLRNLPQILNNFTVVENNGASLANGGVDRATCKQCSYPLAGSLVENNYSLKNITKYFQDTDNWDFRPLEHTSLTSKDVVGPYLPGKLKFYWIPGRRLYKTSTPIPHDGSTVRSDREELMFLEAYRADYYHWYIGKNKTKVEVAKTRSNLYQGKIKAGNNVLELPTTGWLKPVPGNTYYWKVDAQWGDYTYNGDVWSFTAV